MHSCINYLVSNVAQNLPQNFCTRSATPPQIFHTKSVTPAQELTTPSWSFCTVPKLVYNACSFFGNQKSIGIFPGKLGGGIGYLPSIQGGIIFPQSLGGIGNSPRNVAKDVISEMPNYFNINCRRLKLCFRYIITLATPQSYYKKINFKIHVCVIAQIKHFSTD